MHTPRGTDRSVTYRFLFLILAGISLSACTPSTEIPAEPSPAAEMGAWGVDLSARDESVHPGDNFHRYASGTWIDNTEIPADRTRYGSFVQLGQRTETRVRGILEELAARSAAGEFDTGSIEQQVGDYFASAMDTEQTNRLAAQPIEDELATIAKIANTTELARALGGARLLGTTSPIMFSVGIDRLDSDAHLAHLSLTGLSLPERDFYLEDTERFVAIRAAFEAHAARLLELAGYPDAADAAATLLPTETLIAEQQWPRAERRDRDLTYNPTSIDELIASYPGLDWRAYFEGVGVRPDRFNVMHPSSVKAIAESIDDVPLEHWRHYLAYHLVRNAAGYLNEAIETEVFDFYSRTLRGTEVQPERWRRAVARVGSRRGLGDGVGRIYVARYFPPSSKAMMAELVDNLRASMAERIETLEWMTDATRAEAQAKLAAFNTKIGYPDTWRDYSAIEIRRDDLAGNVKRVAEYFYADDLAELNRPVDKGQWFMPPHVVNAYYSPNFNEIVFPAAILQAPFFDPNADPAVNYGGIGAVIGHELGHGFDDQGSKMDGNGVQRNWWTDEDRAAFEARTKKLIARYSAFEPVPGHFVDGAFTLGENIGDLGGIEIAYSAYKRSLGGEPAPVIDGYTGSQRFFLAYAQNWRMKSRDESIIARLKSGVHSPAQFRVLGVLPNVDAWYDAFDVTREQDMYIPPEERVRIW